MSMRSSHPPCLHAAITPNGTAISTVMTSVMRVKANVGSMRCAMSSDTGFFRKKDSPRLPCTNCQPHRPNCTGNGSFKPRLLRMRSRFSALASLPAIAAAGLPGANRVIMKTMSATTNSTGTMATIRRTRKESMGTSVFGDSPEHAHRRCDDTADYVLTDCRELLVLTERCEHRRVIHALLDADCQCLAFGFGVRNEKLVLQRLQPLVGCPAEPPLLPIAGNGCIEERVDVVRNIPAVMKAFQPPCVEGFFMARRATNVGQSIDCISTLKPACLSSAAMTGGNLLSTAKLAGYKSTTGSFWYPASFSRALAFSSCGFPVKNDVLSELYGVPVG